MAMSLNYLPFKRLLRIRPSLFTFAHSRTRAHGEADFMPDTDPIHHSDAWFVKVVYTLFLNSYSPETYLHFLRDKLNPLTAFEVIKQFKNPKLGLNFFEFSRFNLNLNHNIQTCDFLITSLCRRGFHELAMLVFDYMKCDGYFPNNELVAFLLTSFSRACEFDLAKTLLVYIQKERIIITSFMYNNLLDMLVKQNQVLEALCLFQEHLALISPPDTRTLNILMAGFCRAGEMNKAFDLFSAMGNFGCSPDIVSYNTLISGLCRGEKVSRGLELLQEIRSRNDCSPNVVTYTSILSGFCKLGNMRDADNIFKEMVGFGIKPNVITFNILVDGYAKIGDLVSAISQFEMMPSFHCLPNTVTFTSLIDGCCRTGELNQGLKMWDLMKARNIPPNAYTYSVLINALCKVNRLHEARDFLRQMNSHGSIRKAFIYNPVIDGFCKSGNVVEASLIVAEMEEKGCVPDKVTFTILIIGHFMKGRISEAIEIFHKMLAVGCTPDTITMTSLISCLLKCGMPNEAFRAMQMALLNYNLDLPCFMKTLSYS